MSVAMIDAPSGRPVPLRDRLRGTLPAVGLIGACLITLAWWLVVARGLWFAYEWALA